VETSFLEIVKQIKQKYDSDQAEKKTKGIGNLSAEPQKKKKVCQI
jgi:hypothetical protein